jgi:hypothetical protein
MMMIMSIKWDYVSELQLTQGVFFIPQVIYELGETRWNDIDGETPDSPTKTL